MTTSRMLAIAALFLASWVSLENACQAQWLPKYLDPGRQYLPRYLLPTAPEPQARFAKLEPRKNDEIGLRVFELANANCVQLTKVIKPLFREPGGSRIVIVCDERTNTIIARGDESELNVLEGLLMRLDEKVTAKTP